MKRTTLTRKTPLKAKSQLKTKTPLKAKTSLKAKTPMRRSGELKQVVSLKASAPKPTVRRGLQGVGRTEADKAFHTLVAGLGCLACKRLGIQTIFPLRIHHTDGRNTGKSGDYSERRVIPLCDQHHNPQLAFQSGGQKPDMEAPSVHCRKKRFIEMVGTEDSLVEEVYALLSMTAPWEMAT